MSNEKNTGIGEIGILGLLGIAFVILKLCEVINWSWWWVTAPFWIVPIICIVTFICGFVYYGIKKKIEIKHEKKNKKIISTDYEVIE